MTLMGATQATASTYTVDGLLPDYYSAFVPLRAGQFNISNSHFDPRSGTVGIPIPANLDYLPRGTSARLKVLVPPGVNLVTWRLEASSLVAWFGACDEQGTSCADQSYTPTLWPVGYNGQSPTATPVDQLSAVTTPKIVYLTIKTTSIDFDMFSMTVNYNISNPALYEAWRRQRNWAGGAGDCDGLGGLYCNGVATTDPGTTTPGTTTTTTPATTPTATFTLAGMYDMVRAGETYALVSTMPVTRCTATSTSSASATAPTIASSGFMITGTAPALARTETAAALTIRCTAADGSVGQKVLALLPDQSTLTNASVSSQTGAGDKAYLSIKFTPGIYEVGQSASFWVGAQVLIDGHTAIFIKRAGGAWEPYQFTDLMPGHATVNAVPYVASGIDVPVVNGELKFSELIALKAKVFIAYRIDGGELNTSSNPIIDCTSNVCVTY